MESIQFPLQMAADIVVNWASTHQMEISADKTELIFFCRRQRRDVELNITINGTRIHPSPQVRHLGVILDHRLSWRAHIAAKCSKAKQNIFNLRRLSKLTWGSSSQILSHLYRAIVEPMLLYGCFLWAPAVRRQTSVTKLRSVQRLMATTKIRSFRTISTNSSLIIGNWLPFDLRIRQLAILAGIKMNINFSTPYPGHVQFIRADINSCGLTLTDLDYPKPSPLQSLPPWSPQPFSIHVDQRYLPPLCPTVNGHYNIYNDGSKTSLDWTCGFNHQQRSRYGHCTTTP